MADTLDSPLGSEPAAPAPTPGRKRRVIILAALLCPALFFAASLLARRIIQTDRLSLAIPRGILLLITLASALTLLLAQLHHVRHWRRPLIRLMSLVTEVRSGQAPIQELSRIDGPLAPLRLNVQELLRELRQHKAELAEVQLEMRQRLAQRTDVLERHMSALQQQANRDPLTGLHNRRMLEQNLAALVEQARQAHADLCLLMLDLDNFKLLNDTLGHAAGDQFLRAIGQIIRSSLREQDLAFRCGGDEFLIILPHADLRCGQALAGRLTSLVDALGKTLKTPRHVGVSVGVTTLREQTDPDLQALVDAADKRLYALKQARKQAAA
jgi:diguanylate cyclase (GGDEF)-like protein